TAPVTEELLFCSTNPPCRPLFAARSGVFVIENCQFPERVALGCVDLELPPPQAARMIVAASRRIQRFRSRRLQNRAGSGSRFCPQRVGSVFIGSLVTFCIIPLLEICWRSSAKGERQNPRDCSCPK